MFNCLSKQSGHEKNKTGTMENMGSFEKRKRKVWNCQLYSCTQSDVNYNCYCSHHGYQKNLLCNG